MNKYILILYKIITNMLRKLAIIPNNILKLKYNFSTVDWQQIPKPINLKLDRQSKKLLRHPYLKPLPKHAGKIYDSLHIPGKVGQQLHQFYLQFINTKETVLSSQFVGFFLYNFGKNNLLNRLSWEKIEPYIGRSRGQYSLRSIFGCLYGCIQYGDMNYINFFLEELSGQQFSFTDLEALEIIEAFNSSNIVYQTQFKHGLWNKYFRDHFKATLKQGFRIRDVKLALRVFDAFDKFEYYQDADMWNFILSWLQKRKGWKRIIIMQKLYPLSGTFQKAKEIFDTYYGQVSVNQDIIWRYNLEELRLYTSQQMIAKSQQNIKMVPSDRTIVKRKDQKRFNQEYHQWLTEGAKQKEGQLVKDKAQSLAFAIKDRYDSLKKDNVDLSKLTSQEFQDLFGTYDRSILYEPSAQAKKGLMIDKVQQQEQEAKKAFNKDTKKKQKSKKQ